MRLLAYFGKRVLGMLSWTRVCVNTRTSTAQRLLLAGSHSSVCRPRPPPTTFRHRHFIVVLIIV